MHLQAYLRSAQSILNEYKGDIPFAAWLKNYFKQYKKYGSRDRRLITDLCYCYFRLGRAYRERPDEERLLIAQALCHRHSVFITELQPAWLPVMENAMAEKIAFFGETTGPFPFAGELSPEIAVPAFQYSFFQQPDLFLRLRPGKGKVVVDRLKNAGISFTQVEQCLRLPNNTKLEGFVRLDEEAVVQDISSQKVLDSLQQHLSGNTRPVSCWDCCAASGGKSILMHDLYPSISLTVSDIRETILVNLKSRLRRAGIPVARAFVADVSAPGFSLSQTFDAIICDAPCSGSGTWGRTPEQLSYFPVEKIEHYASLQKNISINASRRLKKGGFFVYITCSVFRRENEDVVSFLQQEGHLKLLSQQYIKGYHHKGDTLFAALFTT